MKKTISLALVWVLCLSLCACGETPKSVMEDTCTAYGLTNINIEHTFREKLNENSLYNTTIHCDGVSQMDDEKIDDLFSALTSSCLDVGAEDSYYLEMHMTIYSDGHTYTVSSEKINGVRVDVVLIDGEVLLDKYSEKNRRACVDCGGRGSSYCTACDGRGKRSVTFYSEGDWGYTSYSNYECTRCDGRGRIKCKKCYGEGYFYDFSD